MTLKLLDLGKLVAQQIPCNPVFILSFLSCQKTSRACFTPTLARVAQACHLCPSVIFPGPLIVSYRLCAGAKDRRSYGVRTRDLLRVKQT